MSVDKIPELTTYRITDPDLKSAPKGADDSGAGFDKLLRNDIDDKTTKAAPAPLITKSPALSYGQDIHAAKQTELAATRAQRIEDAKQTRDDILDVGFSNWVQEMRQEKLEEEIRQRILDTLGISEEELSALPADQRQLVEQMILDEIKKQMLAINELNEDEKENNGEKDGTVSIAMLPGAV